MFRPGLAVVSAVALTALATPAADGSLHRAAAALEAGEAEKAAAELIAYGRGDPTAPLANQALDGVLLLRQKKVEAETLAPYVEALAVLADGYAGAADAVFREMAAAEDLPWGLRGRAVLLAADFNSFGDRLALLEGAWAACDDETGRLLGIALAEAYYAEGRGEEAREVRAAFEKKFPGDEGLKYFAYLDEAPGE